MELKPTKFSIGDLPLESGEVIQNAFFSAAVFGRKPSKGIKVVLCRASIAGNHQRLEFLMDQGRALDPEKYCIIATDAFGNGWSSSPSKSPEQRGTKYPRFTLRDMVASQYKLLDVLGIEELFCLIGASMGRIQALQWTAMHSEMLQRVVAMTPQARTSAWSQLANALSREILMQDPNCKRGFVGDDCWKLWGGLMMGLIPGTPKSITDSALEFEDIEKLLKNFQQQAQNRRMDTRDWIWQTFAYDAHDLGDGAKGLTTEQVLQSMQISVPIECSR